jgi:hypothetical protein
MNVTIRNNWKCCTIAHFTTSFTSFILLTAPHYFPVLQGINQCVNRTTQVPPVFIIQHLHTKLQKSFACIPPRRISVEKKLVVHSVTYSLRRYPRTTSRTWLWYTRVTRQLTFEHKTYVFLKKVRVEVNLSHYRPGQALRAPGVWGSQNFQTIGTWRWCGCQPYGPAAFTPQAIHLVLICYRLCRREGHIAAGRIKSVTPSGIEPATFRLVAQYIKQLRHRMPLKQRKYIK